MEQLEQQGTAPGNTEVARSANGTKARAWFFTLNNPDKFGYASLEQLEQDLRTFGAESYVFQLEEGEKEKTPHVQGCAYFKNPRDLRENKTLNRAISWERAKDWRAACNYCSKPDGRLSKVFYAGVVLKIDYPKPKITLNNWQEKLEKMIIEKPNDRHIYWIYERKGNVGKTTMAKYLFRKYNAMVVGGKATDIKYAVCEWLKKRPLEMAIFHFVRSNENYISYQGLEEIKDGFFFSPKYETGMVDIPNPIVVCFANFPPDVTSMSLDRWKIYEMVDGDLKASVMDIAD